MRIPLRARFAVVGLMLGPTRPGGFRDDRPLVRYLIGPGWAELALSYVSVSGWFGLLRRGHAFLRSGPCATGRGSGVAPLASPRSAPPRRRAEPSAGCPARRSVPCPQGGPAPGP